MDEKSEPTQPDELPPNQQSEGQNDCTDAPLKDPGAQVLRSAGASLESELIAISFEVAKT